jgi:hypothetical protein
MEVWDFNGSCQVSRDDEVLARLRSVRRGTHGAFVLSHGGEESLYIHINRDAAFLCFFPLDRSGGHPGFVPDHMWPATHCDVDFLLVGGDEADSITVPWDQLVPVDIAYRAAVEFLRSPTRPRSVKWFEL